MDKVKAIEVLKPLVESYVDYANITMKEEDDDIAEALEMAVEALKALDVPNTNVGDMISRQAAIDIAVFECGEWAGLAKEISKQLKQLPSAQPEILACGEGELNVPDTNVGDMISRQAAIDALDVLCQEHRYKIPGKRETYSQYNEAWQDALDRAEGAIFNLPTVQPDHTADVSKKAEGDCISRRVALDCATYDVEHTIECLKALPSAQPEIIRCKDCKHRHVENMVWTCPFGLPGGENFFCGYGTEPYKGE